MEEDGNFVILFFGKYFEWKEDQWTFLCVQLHSKNFYTPEEPCWRKSNAQKICKKLIMKTSFDFEKWERFKMAALLNLILDLTSGGAIPFKLIL